MNRVLRWLVLPAVLLGGILVFSSSQAEAGRLLTRTCYPAFCGYGYTYSPSATADCDWTPAYVGSPIYGCPTNRTDYCAPSISLRSGCFSGCNTGCTSCGY